MPTSLQTAVHCAPVCVVDDAEALPSPMHRQIYTYWTSRLGGRAMPDFADISAAELMMFLPFCHVYDVIGPVTGYHVRVHGTRVSARTGFDLTGMVLTRADHEDSKQRVVSLLDQVCAAKRPLTSRSTRVYCEGWNWPAGASTLWLPLTHGGEDVSVVMAVTDFASVSGGGDEKPSNGQNLQAA